MNLDSLFNVLGAIVTLAVVTVIFTSRNTAEIIKASGSAFAGSLKAATGR